MGLETPEGYTALGEATVAAFLAGLPAVAKRLGGGPKDWTVGEVGDGNLNLVFLVDGPKGGVCVKQSLPYVRLVGEGWPMPLERAFFERSCLAEHGRHVGRLIPEVYHYDPLRFAIVMEKLSPHIIMRRGMIEAVRYPSFADHISTYMARALFFTSDLALPAPEKKQKVKLFCDNTELCRITEDLIFTDPYRVHERNRWTSPQLDGIAADIRADCELKLAVSTLKLKFLTRAEALLHGDLHTGSVMVTEDDSRVIDPEFAFFGPMGFDIGAVIGNLLLNYFAQDGHATSDRPRDDYQDWVLETVDEVWSLFQGKFLALWADHPDGDAYPADLFADAEGAEALAAAKHVFMRRLFADALGFGAAKMIRRILGLAHNIDLEWIEDPDRRAVCETRALKLARDLMVNTSDYRTIADVTAAARETRAKG
ncbi:MAG: S-methyl-5-thioribose kinase [Inquilinus sp.]|nr:S-methyl-5-thioribose kinase [Inquilinus sp.]